MSASATRPAKSGTRAVLERGLDTSNGLDFVRERLALVDKTLFLVSLGFYLFLLASMVLDFGLVKLDAAREAGHDAVKLSTGGSAGGTPALGCVGYWLLTGKLIFEGGSVVEVMFHHAHTPPPRPSTTSELPIPAPLEDLLMECLEKDPARRPTSAEAVSTRLDAVSLASAWTVERAERWWAMHRPLPADARRVAEVLLSQEGREVRIGPRVRA